MQRASRSTRGVRPQGEGRLDRVAPSLPVTGTVVGRGPRHIVLLAPPWYPVPPRGYGGIELVVALLARELRTLGHHVTLFASQGSEQAEVCAPSGWGRALGLPAALPLEGAYLARVLRRLRVLPRIDVIHDHSGPPGLLCSMATELAPVVHTVHGPLCDEQRMFYREVADEVSLVAISRAQRETAPAVPWAGMVHNAVDVERLRAGTPDHTDPYLLCLARISAEKGQDEAIEVARRAGMRLVLAGKVDETPETQAYNRERVAPHVDGRHVVYLPNVSGAEKARLLARGTALLAPIQWEEPFGLSIAEAMASGTPVVATARGSAPELVVDGVTGFLADTVDDMVEAVRRVHEIDPLECARIARERFHPSVMASGYLQIYEAAMASPDAPQLTAVGPGDGAA
jgi:glycosyltransferase involved in cell wall biosynthesis